MDPPVLTLCISTNDNEAMCKFSSLYYQPSQRRSEHKLFQTLHPIWIHHNSKKTYWIILSSQYAHILMIMKHCTKFQVSIISHLRGEVSTSYFTLSTPLGSTITQRKIIGSSSLTICTTTNDNEALYKVSSLYDQPSQSKSEHKIFHTTPLLDPP